MKKHNSTQGTPRIGSGALLGVISLGTINKFLERIAHGLTHRRRQMLWWFGVNKVVSKCLVCWIACLAVISASGIETSLPPPSNVPPPSGTQVAHLVSRAVSKCVDIPLIAWHLSEEHIYLAVESQKSLVPIVAQSNPIATEQANDAREDGDSDRYPYWLTHTIPISFLTFWIGLVLAYAMTPNEKS
jgi:hypothetical protein